MIHDWMDLDDLNFFFFIPYSKYFYVPTTPSVENASKLVIPPLFILTALVVFKKKTFLGQRMSSKTPGKKAMEAILGHFWLFITKTLPSFSKDHNSILRKESEPRSGQVSMKCFKECHSC